MKKTTLYILILFLFSGIGDSLAQGLLYEIAIEDKIQNSSSIIEGKVIDSYAFWNDEQTHIYTANIVEVYKVFKGNVVDKVEVITQGGTVGLSAETVTPSLQLKKDEFGIFLLTDTNVNTLNATNFQRVKAYADQQGFYKYDYLTGNIRSPFQVQALSEKQTFYQQIRNLTGQDIQEVRVMLSEIKENPNDQRGSTAITSFTPTTSNAGTGTMMTINGTGFGTTAQNVGFANADTGGSCCALALQSQIVSWSDTVIEVVIPSGAGNGQIAIIDNPPTTILAASAQTLTVPYNHINATADPDGAGPLGDYSADTQHYNDNGTGGYTWQMFTDFDGNTAAKEAFTRALNTWRCETDVNWTVGSVSTTDATASDGTNIIRFDNGGELDPGVLGVCFNYWSGCLVSATDIEWYTTEMDLAFDDGTTWEFGPAAPSGVELDFESVAVHELGHAHQLGHVIDPSKIMHFAIGPGVSLRTLSTDDIDGANAVHARSTGVAVCAQPLMTDFDCSTLSIDENELVNNLRIYPVPAQNEINIETNNFMGLSVITLFDITGKQVLEANLDEPQSIYTLDIRALSQGVYLARLNIEGLEVVKKIIVD